MARIQRFIFSLVIKSSCAIIVKIENKDSFEQEWPKIAKLVREAALEEIRPVSHNLWADQPQTFREFNFRNFLISAIRTNPFPWKIVIPIYAITSYVAIIFTLPQGVNLLTIIEVLLF